MRVRTSVVLPALALASVALVQAAAPAQGGEAAGHAQGGEAAGPSRSELGRAMLAAADVASSPPAVVGSSPPAADAAPSRPASAELRRPRAHRLALVRGELALAARPGGQRTIRVGSRTEFGWRQVLAVAKQRGDWLGLVTSQRPNNRLAWVHRRNRSLALRRTSFELRADLSARTLTLLKGGGRVHRLTVAIGRPGSGTPVGRFAVTDKVSGARFSPYYGCCVLALNGHQPNTPAGWSGGNRLAIHGTDSPATIGAAASAGCLRAADADLRVLMAKVPLGTPVFIRR